MVHESQTTHLSAYAGRGLWGRDYRVDGPTEMRYALMPHAGRWDKAGVSAMAASWREPVVGAFSRGGQVASRTIIAPPAGWEIPAMFERDGALFVRLFNASGDATPQHLAIGFESKKIELVELDGRIIAELKPDAADAGQRSVRLTMPRFGIRTLRFIKPEPVPMK